MEFIATLKQKYGVNNPITIQEIRDQYDYSNARITQLITKALKEEKMVRYYKGIYYLPTKTILGLSNLSYDSFLEKKYIRNKNDVYGYYVGLSFMNKIGLTTQVPNVPEIVTNDEKTNCREITFKNKKIILRKAKVEIEKKNYKELQYLDFINTLDENYLKKYRDILVAYYNKNINREVVRNVVNSFPDRTAKNLIRLGVVTI